MYRAARLRKGGLKLLHVGSVDDAAMDAAATRDSAVVGVCTHVGLLRGVRWAGGGRERLTPGGRERGAAAERARRMISQNGRSPARFGGRVGAKARPAPPLPPLPSLGG